MENSISKIITNAIATDAYKNPYAGINFIQFNPIIVNKDGKEIFNEVVVFPDYFKENDVKIVASKYLANRAKRKETDIREMIDRVANTITDWAIQDGHFKSDNEALDFNYKLKYYHIHQYFAFNSPVYFNIGLEECPPLSACFILSVDDTMDSITDWLKNSSKIFKGGSGEGANLSKLRSSKERVRGGGFASGPVSFLKASDTCAGIIKSGGTLRRAAKMACLNIDHPDILDFISCKDREEEKLRILKANGFEAQPGYELSDEVYFQNTNLSVRLTDEFMLAVKNDDIWQTKEVLTGKSVNTFNAKDLLMDISRHAWLTGDPGIFHHDNINAMNTVPDEGTIESSNPCGEWNFLNDTQCNLAAFNALKFFSIVDGDVIFDINLFEDVMCVMTTSQDIFCDHGKFPTEKIRKNAKRYHTIGAGFSNIAALVMYLGYPYDSPEARAVISALSSLMTALAYKISADLGDKLGITEWWENEANHASMFKVMKTHKRSADNINTLDIPVVDFMKRLGCTIWKDLIDFKRAPRTASATLIAPTGTTGYLLGCTSYGPEPFFSLISYKTLSGNDGATIKLVVDTPKLALKNLGYNDEIIEYIITDMIENDIPIENSKWIKDEHIPIFDTSLVQNNGTRSINYMGHVEMLAAIQPFISSAISKTINMANDCTVEDIFDLYMYTWEKGLKSITVYRDGSKTEQVLNTSDKKKKDKILDSDKEPVELSKPYRKRMPIDGNAKRHKFSINGDQTQGYILSGMLENGELGEIFIEGTNFGSTLGGFMDTVAIITSIALQYGVPLDVLVSKLMHSKFEPAGFTANADIRSCTSMVAYIFRYLGLTYLTEEKKLDLGLIRKVDNKEDVKVTSNNASICPQCGSLLVILGTCESCSNCGFSSGTCG